MNDDLECPYCGAGQDVNHDDGQGYDQDCQHTMECSECDKSFVFTTAIIFHYTPEKADCLNGGEHQLKHIIGFPKEFFEDKYRCSDCGEEFYKPELKASEKIV